MEHFWLVTLLREKKGLLVLIGALFAALGFAVLLATSTHYRVETDFLVSQEDAGSKDYYTLARSSEYIGKILGEVVYSERFIDAVIETKKVNPEFLPFDKKDRLEEWQKMVKVEKQLDLGIIKVTLLNDDVREAQRVSQAISQVLIEKNGLFLGSGEKNIPVSVLSGPITERNPSTRQILSVLMGGFIFGMLLVVLRLFIRGEAFAPKAF